MPAKSKATEFGIAMRNFTKYPELPDAQALIEYGVRVEALGYESIWAWDHILFAAKLRGTHRNVAIRPGATNRRSGFPSRAGHWRKAASIRL